MREREPMTQILKASEARQQFSQLLNQVFRKQTRVLVEKSGIPVAAIVSADDLQRLTRYEEERRADFAIVDELRGSFADVPDHDLEAEVARAVVEARAAARKDRAAKRLA